MFVDEAKQNDDDAALFKRMNVAIDPTVEVGRLTVARQQLVEIAKALSFNSKVLVMEQARQLLLPFGDKGREAHEPPAPLLRRQLAPAPVLERGLRSIWSSAPSRLRRLLTVGIVTFPRFGRISFRPMAKLATKKGKHSARASVGFLCKGDRHAGDRTGLR